MQEIDINDFFDKIRSGYATKLEIYNTVEQITDNFQYVKLKLLKDDFDIYFCIEKDEHESTFTEQDIWNKIEYLKKQNKPIPYLPKIEIKGKNGKILKTPDNILDKEQLLFPFEFFSCYQFQNLLNTEMKKAKEINNLNNLSNKKNEDKTIENYNLWYNEIFINLSEIDSYYKEKHRKELNFYLYGEGQPTSDDLCDNKDPIEFREKLFEYKLNALKDLYKKIERLPKSDVLNFLEFIQIKLRKLDELGQIIHNYNEKCALVWEEYISKIKEEIDELIKQYKSSSTKIVIKEINQSNKEEDFNKLRTLINNAFFRLESFMNGTLQNYKYFGFNDAFTNLFIEAKKPEFYTFDNCKLISKYYELTGQISVDYDKSNFDNEDAYENEDFCKDCEEIMNLNFDRVEEFCEFITTDEIEENERKFSIIDILKNQNSPSQKQKVEIDPILPVNDNKIQNDNDLLTSTIEDYLFEFKEKMSKSDFDILVSALKQYIEKGNFPNIKKIIIVSKVNKKDFGWALHEIYKKFKNDKLSKEYLQFAKQYISLFNDVNFDEKNIINCNLYKYFTSKPSHL